VRRATQQRIDGLYCLLAEQVLPHERLLWRGGPDPKGSGAARVNLYRYGSILSVASFRVMGLSAGLAALVFFSMRGSGPPTDETTASAVVAAFFTFYLALLACLVAYWIVQMARAGDIPWPLWRWRPIRNLLRFPRTIGGQDDTVPLIEPPAAPTRSNQVIYGLTDQRVIVLVDGQLRSVRSYWLHEITGVRCIDARDGWGDLALVVEESTLDFEEAESTCTTVWEEVRLWGIERASCVAQALDCLIARQPLHAAIAALAYGSAAAQEPGGHGRGDGLPRGALPKARMWQVTFWRGSSEAQLEPLPWWAGGKLPAKRHRRGAAAGVCCAHARPVWRPVAPAGRDARPRRAEHSGGGSDGAILTSHHRAASPWSNGTCKHAQNAKGG
jgi:hypothetical protein